MITKEHIDSLLSGRGDVLTEDGEKVGGIGQIYLDDESDQPSWVTVKTGLFGSHESFVPLEGARPQGEDLVIPYSKDQVKDAPRVDPDGHLEPGEEERLYEYYQGAAGLSGRRTGDRVESTDSAGGYDRSATGGDAGMGAAGTVGRDTSGPTTDDAMTRSEERLNVGAERHEAGRARLRKYVTTENVTRTVPVRREEVRLEREPITEGNRGAALNGPELSEDEHEVTLHEERPVVDKETIPVERVRLGKETVTDEQTVDEEVAREHIETEGVDERGR